MKKRGLSFILPKFSGLFYSKVCRTYQDNIVTRHERKAVLSNVQCYKLDLSWYPLRWCMTTSNRAQATNSCGAGVVQR